MNDKKVIIITGASSGIGKETALKLIQEGHIVYGAARRIEKMQELVKAGGHAVDMDVTQQDQVDLAIEKIIQEQGKIDVLINNAGYGLYGAVEDIPIEKAQNQFDVNLFGLARVTKAVLPTMRAQKSGKIINVSSMGGKMYTPMGAWYHATKHALEGWSDCLRLELKQFGIDVVIIEPGAIKTEFGEVAGAPLLKYSGEGPYSKLAHVMAKVTENAYSEEGKPSPPSVISEVIADAIRSSSPKTRYAKGRLAKPLLFIRRWFSDRFFDKAVMSQVNRMLK